MELQITYITLGCAFDKKKIADAFIGQVVQKIGIQHFTCDTAVKSNSFTFGANVQMGALGIKNTDIMFG